MIEQPSTAAAERRGWGDTLRVYAEPPTLRMFFLGFAAGLPLLLVLGTLSFRLREAGIDRTTIGYLSWVGLAYGFKWAWAPLVDRLALPWLTRTLGRRRSWLLASQLMIIAGLMNGAVQPAGRAGTARLVRTNRCIRIRHAGHRSGRLSHRVGARRETGGFGRDLPDGVPARDDLGRRRRALDRGARRG